MTVYCCNEFLKQINKKTIGNRNDKYFIQSMWQNNYFHRESLNFKCCPWCGAKLE